MSQGSGYTPQGYGSPSGFGSGFGAPPGGYGPPGNFPSGTTPAGPWSPGDAIGFGWTAVKGDFVGVGLPIALFLLVVGGLGGIVGGIFSVISNVLVSSLTTNGGEDAPMVALLITQGFSVVQQVVTVVIQAFFMGGMIDFCLKVVRGTKPPLGTVFGGSRYFVPMLIGQLLLSLAVGIGVLLCLVPGIILALGLMFWSYLVVDRGVGAMDALKQSWALTNGHKWTLLVFSLLAMLVALLGMLACCVGLFVAVPVISIATAYVYLRLSGEQPSLPAT